MNLVVNPKRRSWRSFEARKPCTRSWLRAESWGLRAFFQFSFVMLSVRSRLGHCGSGLNRGGLKGLGGAILRECFEFAFGEVEKQKRTELGDGQDIHPTIAVD